MKRNKSNCKKLIDLCHTDALLKKQLTEFMKLPMKEQAIGAVRLGRMHGLYFSENDWSSTVQSLSPMPKAA